jgi:hypothetical protein
MTSYEEIAALEQTIAERPHAGETLWREWEQLAKLHAARADAAEAEVLRLRELLGVMMALLRDVPVIYNGNACEECGAPLDVPRAAVIARMRGETPIVDVQRHKAGCYQGRISAILEEPEATAALGVWRAARDMTQAAKAWRATIDPPLPDGFGFGDLHLRFALIRKIDDLIALEGP